MGGAHLASQVPGMRENSPHRGFNFTQHVRALCQKITADIGPLGHVQMSRVAVRYCQTRRQGPFGMQASLSPLRFERGARHRMHRGRWWTIQTVRAPDGEEALYLLSFYLPRFMDLPFEEKVATVVHELWHISPDFDGDLRRFQGRCFAHGTSEAAFHNHCRTLAQGWLEMRPPEELIAFLRHDFHSLAREHGAIFGSRITTPKLIPIAPA